MPCAQACLHIRAYARVCTRTQQPLLPRTHTSSSPSYRLLGFNLAASSGRVKLQAPGPVSERAGQGEGGTLRRGPLNSPASTTSLINERVLSSPSNHPTQGRKSRSVGCWGAPAQAARASCFPATCQVGSRLGKRGQCHPGELPALPPPEPNPSLFYPPY